MGTLFDLVVYTAGGSTPLSTTRLAPGSTASAVSLAVTLAAGIYDMQLKVTNGNNAGSAGDLSIKLSSIAGEQRQPQELGQQDWAACWCCAGCCRACCWFLAPACLTGSAVCSPLLPHPAVACTTGEFEMPGFGASLAFSQDKSRHWCCSLMAAPPHSQRCSLLRPTIPRPCSRPGMVYCHQLVCGDKSFYQTCGRHHLLLWHPVRQRHLYKQPVHRMPCHHHRLHRLRPQHVRLHGLLQRLLAGQRHLHGVHRVRLHHVHCQHVHLHGLLQRLLAG